MNVPNVPNVNGVETPNVGVPNVGEVAGGMPVNESAPVAVSGVAVEEVKAPRTKAEKWAAAEALMDDKFKSEYGGLYYKLVDLFKPSTGGGFSKDWSKRIESRDGKLLAKFDKVLGAWLRDSAFSKNKYESKGVYAAIQKKLREIDTSARAKLIAGQALDDVERVVFDPNSTGEAKEAAILPLIGDKLQEIANNYATTGEWLGDKASAISTLQGEGAVLADECLKS